MTIERDLYKKFMNENKLTKNEATVDGRHDIDFDSFGGSISVFADATLGEFAHRKAEDEYLMEIGLNSSSRGNIFYKRPLEKPEGTTEDEFWKGLRKVEIEEHDKIQAGLKSLCDEFDAKIIDYMRSQGYEKA